MRIWILRHGETEWTAAHRMCGMHDIPLSAKGKEQAEVVHQEIVKQNLVFDRVYTSPLKRAQETVGIAVPDNQIKIDDRIREISFGTLEGELFSLDDPDILQQLPGNIRNFSQNPSAFIPAKDGESIQSVIERTGDFWKDLQECTGQNDKILIVSHGCALHALLYNMYKKADLDSFWEPKIGNCKLMEVQV